MNSVIQRQSTTTNAQRAGIRTGSRTDRVRSVLAPVSRGDTAEALTLFGGRRGMPTRYNDIAPSREEP